MNDPLIPKSAPAVSQADELREALEQAVGTQYRVRRLLGRGGMGAVYLAHEEALDRQVAIKVLPPEAADPVALERFRREARVAARMSHPNIVPLYTFGEADGLVYFVMGYVEGESLRDVVRRRGSLDERYTRSVLGTLARALAYAHEQGVLHRDVKPDNILIEAETGRPFLADFGIARGPMSGGTLTAAGSLVGTPHYVSPEQATGERELDGRSDLYSLGVVGYFMLTGREPFTGSSLQEIVTKHVASEPEPLNRLSPRVSPEVRGAIMRCLRKNPEDRWIDGNALAEVLDVKRFGEEPPLPGLEGASRRTRASVAVAIGGLIAIPVLLLAGASSLWVALAAVVALAGVAEVVGLYQAGRGEGYETQTVLRAMFRPPRWWPGPLPRWLRPAEDVRDLLPDTVRRHRDWGQVGGLIFWSWTLLGLVAAFISNFKSSSELDGVMIAVLTVSALGLVLGAGMFVYHLDRLERELRRRLDRPDPKPGRSWWVGFIDADDPLYHSNSDARRLMSEPTFGSRFWARPDIASILRTTEGGPVRSEVERVSVKPEERVALIRSVALQLEGESRSLAQSAAEAARQIVAALDDLDSEIGALAAEAPTEEVQRLEERLERLGSDRRDVVELVEGQLKLARRLVERLDDMTARRGRLLDLLRTVELHVADLKAQAAQDAAASGDITGKILALCEEIEHQVSAEQEVTAMLVRSDPPPEPT